METKTATAATGAAQAVATGPGHYPPVMTVEEIAAYLQIGARSIYTMAAAGELPAVKIAGQWRFYRAAVDDWLAEQSRASVAKNVA